MQVPEGATIWADATHAHAMVGISQAHARHTVHPSMAVQAHARHMPGRPYSAAKES